MLNLIFGHFSDESSTFYHLFQEKIKEGVKIRLPQKATNLENLIYIIWRYYIKCANDNLLNNFHKARTQYGESVHWLNVFNYGLVFPGDVIEISYGTQTITFTVSHQGSLAWCDPSLYKTIIDQQDIEIKLISPSSERKKTSWMEGNFITHILEEKIKTRIGSKPDKQFKEKMTPVKSIVSWIKIQNSFPEDFNKMNKGWVYKVDKTQEDFILHLRKRLWTLKDQSLLLYLESSSP